MATAHVLGHGGGRITFPPGEYVSFDDGSAEWAAFPGTAVAAGLVVELFDGGDVTIRPSAVIG